MTFAVRQQGEVLSSYPWQREMSNKHVKECLIKISRHLQEGCKNLGVAEFFNQRLLLLYFGFCILPLYRAVVLLFSSQSRFLTVNQCCSSEISRRHSHATLEKTQEDLFF